MEEIYTLTPEEEEKAQAAAIPVPKVEIPYATVPEEPKKEATVRTVFESFLPRYVAERNPAYNTVLMLKQVIPRFLNWIQIGRKKDNLAQVNREDILAYLNSLEARTSTKKAHKAIITLFMNGCYDYGFLSERMETINFRGVSDIPRAPLKGFTAGEMAQMRQKADRLTPREKVLFGLLSNRPLRISELVSLTVGNVDLAAKTFALYRTKNTKTRILTIPQDIYEDLQVLIGDRPKEESLFGIRLRMMEFLCREIILKLGVKPQGRASHAFRHTVITSMLREAGIEPSIVAKIAGNTPKTIYNNYTDAVSIDEQRKAEKSFDQAKKLRKVKRAKVVDWQLI